MRENNEFTYITVYDGMEIKLKYYNQKLYNYEI